MIRIFSAFGGIRWSSAFREGAGKVGSRRRCAVDRYVRYEWRRMEPENLPFFGVCPTCDRRDHTRPVPHPKCPVELIKGEGHGHRRRRRQSVTYGHEMPRMDGALSPPATEHTRQPPVNLTTRKGVQNSPSPFPPRFPCASRWLLRRQSQGS